MIASIQDKANVLEKNEDGTWSKTEVSASQLIPDLENTFFCDIGGFHRRILDDNYEDVFATLNDKGLSEADRIIIDQYLITASRQYHCRRIRIMEDSSPLILYMLSSNPDSLIITDSHDRKVILRGLSGDMGSAYYWKEITQVKRYAIPALEGYRELALNTLPLGARLPYIGSFFKSYYILSPFDSGTAKQAQLMSKAEFIDLATTSDTFPNVVKYVQKHSPWSEPFSVEQITEKYRKLIGEYYDAMKNYQKELTPEDEKK